MKATLLTRAAPALLLAAALACGSSIGSLAATTSATAGQQNATTAAATNGTSGATSTATGANQATAPSSTASADSANAASGQQTMQQMAEQRIEELRSRLQITAKEQPAWNKFANVMRDNARQLDQAYRQRGQTFDSMSAVDNMKSYAKIEQMRARDVQKLVPAFQSLYASLSTQQKQEADTLFRNRSESAQQRHSQATQPATH